MPSWLAHLEREISLVFLYCKEEVLLALEKYEEMFPAFTDSRECKLLKKLLEAHEEQNCEAYTEAVKEFDSISRLDQWLTTMLLRIKKSIQGENDGDLK
ncbi:Beta-soluble NSF attachment protein [Varanus komodoensis]|nr:Beta-soluble NSF attachment protein [Varanus komodoensis]